MSWTQQLRPASFAGFGFYVAVHKGAGGRRLIERQIPFAQADLSDLGALPKHFTVTAYVLGDGWLVQREGLLKILDASATAQTLVLPTKGPLRVRVGTYTYQDDEKIGAYGAVEIEFIQDNAIAAPLASADTAGNLLNNITGMLAAVSGAYEAVMGPIVQTGAIASYAVGLLASASAAFLTLPQALVGGIAANFSGTATDPAATAAAVTGAFLAASDAALDVLNPPLVSATAASGILPQGPAPSDPSYGLAALAGFGEDLPPAAASPAGLAVAQAAIVALVQQSAAIATISLYAQATFATAQGAAAARAQLSGLLDATGAAICDGGQVDLYRAWLALSALATTDMIQRAQNLPQIANYGVAAQLPDVVLAQLLYQDGGQGDALAVLNTAIHPLFMPAAGLWLQAA